MSGYRRRFAERVAACALRLLPPARRPWAHAMQSEMAYLSDSGALQWALGCLRAAATERIYAMLTGDLKVSRAILVPEMLLCFLPLSLLWLDAAQGALGLVHLSAPLMHRYFLDRGDGQLMLLLLSLGAIVGVMGPLGLLAALWSILSRRPLKNRFVGAACVVGPVILGLAYFASAIFLQPNGFQDMWRFYALLALPALGAWHLMHIGLWPAAADVKTS